MPTGIYKIVNLIDGKVYVGQAINLEKRRKQHFKDLRGGYHRNLRMQRAFTRDGEANFRFEVIEECSAEMLTACEQYWLDFFDTRYNICPAAESNRGMKWSDESRKKQSEIKKAVDQPWLQTPESRKKASETRRKNGKKWKMSPEQKAAHSAALKARFALKPKAKMSDESKARMAASKKKWWARQTEESKKARGELMRGSRNG